MLSFDLAREVFEGHLLDASSVYLHIHCVDFVDERQLLAKYRETKDQTYLADLYRPYMPLVYGSCLKYFKNEVDAQDAVMDIFEKLTKKTLTSKVDYFKSWLFVVTRNHCLEKLRQKTARRDRQIDAQRVYSENVFHPDSVNREQELQLLQECMGRLETFQQTCINLFYFKKMSYADIATELDLQYNQVRSRIQNGRRNIKRCMDQNSSRLDLEL
ncbi:MAG: sigma-70 family RNA polymerase sigma factor [Bacteroidota bacterium]